MKQKIHLIYCFSPINGKLDNTNYELCINSLNHWKKEKCLIDEYSNKHKQYIYNLCDKYNLYESSESTFSSNNNHTMIEIKNIMKTNNIQFNKKFQKFILFCYFNN